MFPNKSFVLAFLVVLLCAPLAAYLQFSRNVAAKRTLAPLMWAVSSLLSALIVHALTGSVVLAGVVGVFGLLSRGAKGRAPQFCDRCGRTIRRNPFVSVAPHCPYCGAPLGGRGSLL